MKITTMTLLVLVSLLFFSACFSPAIIVFVSPQFDKYDPQTFAVFPFSDLRRKKHLNPDAANLMTDAFETAFMKTGYSIVERRKIKKVIDEITFSYQGNVDSEQLKELGMMTNADVVVLGLLRAFYPAQYTNQNKPEKASHCTTISFSVKAIHIASGEILWKGSITKSTGIKGDMLYRCDYTLLHYGDKVAMDMVEQIKKKIKATGRPSVSQ